MKSIYQNRCHRRAFGGSDFSEAGCQNLNRMPIHPRHDWLLMKYRPEKQLDEKDKQIAQLEEKSNNSKRKCKKSANRPAKPLIECCKLPLKEQRTKP